MSSHGSNVQMKPRVSLSWLSFHHLPLIEQSLWAFWFGGKGISKFKRWTENTLGCLFEFYICIPITVSQGCIIYHLKHFSTVMNELWASLPVCVLIFPHSLGDLKAWSISTELCSFPWVKPVVSLRVFKSLKNSIGTQWKEYLQKDSLKGRG